MLEKIVGSKEYSILRKDQKSCTIMLVVMSVIFVALMSLVLGCIYFSASNNVENVYVSQRLIAFCELVTICLFSGYDIYCLYCDKTYSPLNIKTGVILKESVKEDVSMGDNIVSYLVKAGEKEISCKSVSRDIKYNEGDEVIIWNGKGWDNDFYLCLSYT